MDVDPLEFIVYPDSDGQPMAENTLQYQWIVMLQGNIDRILDDFVAGDLLWYPVRGRPDIRRAPDVLVALGRPKGHRGSYLQWKEEDHPPDVVMEFLSPGNTVREMREKHAFYDKYGVQEYYVLDPDHLTLQVSLRDGDGELRQQSVVGGFESPRLGLRFEVRDASSADGPSVRVFRPDGQEFRTFAEVFDDVEAARSDAEAARSDAEAARSDAEAARSDAEAARSDVEQVRAEARAAEARAAALAEKLRALGIDPDALP